MYVPHVCTSLSLQGAGKACTGTAWALNGCSEPLGFWQVGSTSLWELREPLRALGRRAMNLGTVRWGGA